MTDARRRELERSAGDPQARARLLLERVRAGELAHDRVRLAAWLGDETARLACGEEPPTSGLRRWLEGIEERGGPEVAAWALAEALATLGGGVGLDALVSDVRAAAGTGRLRALAEAMGGELAQDPVERNLRSVLDRLWREPHRARDDDLDALSAVQKAKDGALIQGMGSWTYVRTERERSQRGRPACWQHVVRCVWPQGGETLTFVTACAFWEPPAGRSLPVGPVLDGLIPTLQDEATARQAVRTALLPWAV